MPIPEPAMASGDDLAIARLGLHRGFPGCDHSLIEITLAQLRHRQLRPGEVLIGFDALARSAYLLVEGQLQVYGRSQDGELVAITTLDTPGRLLGEQALLPGHHYRNADVVALTACRVAELPEACFRRLLDATPLARQQLLRQGMVELRERLGRLGVGLEAAVITAAEAGSIQLRPGERLLEVGRIPAQAYSIVAGQLGLQSAQGRDPVVLLGSGSLVGVEELVAQKPFPYDAIAQTTLELLPIPGERLQLLLGSEVTRCSLQALVALPGLGRVYRHRTVHGGELAVISNYSDVAGGPVRIRQIPGSRRLEATRQLSPQTSVTPWCTPDGVNQLLVESQTGRLLGLAVDQAWPPVSELVALLLRNATLTSLQLEAVQFGGQLLLEAPEARVERGSPLVCACTATSATRLRELAPHCNNLADLQRITAAGTVCGGCLSRLPLFLDQPADAQLCWLDCQPLAKGALRVGLWPIDDAPLLPWRAGEHLQLEALIEGRWIGRQYTLTGGDGRHYEIGVKCQSGGVLSTWLAQAGRGSLVRISAPQGQLVPAADDPRPLLYLVAGIGVTPAIAGCRRLAQRRTVTVAYCFRGEDAAAYLPVLRQIAADGGIRLVEHDSSTLGRLEPRQWLASLAALLNQPVEVVICGPEAFHRVWSTALSALPAAEVRIESFTSAGLSGDGSRQPGSWRLTPDALAERRRLADERFGPCPQPVPVDQSCPLEEMRVFFDAYRREVDSSLDLEQRLGVAIADLRSWGRVQLSHAELCFGARLAWRQAERCVGRLYWQGLELFDRRDLHRAAEMAEALFEHLRFAYNGGDLRPAISVFDPGDPDRVGPRIWNPQLLRYAGYRSAGGRQIGDPAQNRFTSTLMRLGWKPSGDPFELLPVVIETAAEGPCLFALPAECRQEVLIRHPRHGWLEQLALRWYAVPAVSDMALDLAGTLYRMVPFNGWYLDTEIAARNFSDENRFNLLPRIAEGLGLDLHDDRSLWRDRAQLLLAEAVLYSFDQAGVKISDHHGIGHEFLEFCRAEQHQGREPQAEWSWVVPPMSGALNVLYQEPFENQGLKPAFVEQPPAWVSGEFKAVDGDQPRCPFSG
jgi:nitric oxide synthase oxygenase domain/subunit/ferredoxin-NADP reductase/CRP-like cAMP-binding protein/bacterioferritin-associated ferredoxin